MVLVLTLASSAANAAVTQNPKGKFLGVVPNVKPGLALPAVSAAQLTYHGGPVMHSDKNYAIYWEPSGHATPASYKSAINSYFTNVAADSGKSTNVYSTDTQYSDGSGNIAYNVSSGSPIVDANPYPASGCPQTGGNPCLTDAQLGTEINRVINASGLPRGLGTIYYVFTPQNVASCFDAAGTQCSTNVFCAYHSSFGSGASTTLYADQPYAAITGCDPGQRPNSTPADATINVVSHENNESITDPLGTAWYDSSGNENGDKCNFNFGSPLGGASGALFNQQISTGIYWLQQEWSNAIGGCAQRTAVANDFSIAASPSSVSVAPGGNATSSISTTLVSGSAQSTTLSASGLPSGASAAFSPSVVNTGGSSTLTITTSASTPAGSYPIVVTGTGTSATHQVTVTLTVTSGPAAAAFTYPTAGQTNVDTTQPFTWSTIPSAQYYYLTVGTTQGGYDLVNSGVLPASQSSYGVPALPTGQTLYARIYTLIGGGWNNYQDITFTAAPRAAAFTYPTAGQTNVDTTKPFTWSTIASAQNYYLTVGTTQGGYDLVNSGVLPASQSSYGVPALPTGQTLYARIYTLIGGGWNNYQDITFTAAPNAVMFTYPTAGQTNVDTTKPFTWSTIASAQYYYLTVGTTQGGYDLVNSGVLPASQSSYGVPALPTGQTLYARIYTLIGGGWNNYQDITFTAAPRPGFLKSSARDTPSRANGALHSTLPLGIRRLLVHHGRPPSPARRRHRLRSLPKTSHFAPAALRAAARSRR